MPSRKITAKIGDSLCNIAFLNGFGDCKPLREDPANAFIVNRADDPGQVRPGDIVTVPEFILHTENKGTEKKHKFVKRDNFAILRFVHGSLSSTLKNDLTLRFLNVSNYVTNRAGVPDGSTAFPTTADKDFNVNADKDQDAFKIEVLDIDATADLTVELEVLRPTYNAAGTVTGHERFPAAIRTNRLLTATAFKQGSTNRFRTAYLRLVTDAVDKAAANDQTLLTSDIYDVNDAAAKKVEILDQTVKASYTIAKCPQTPKCKSTVILPIGGTDRRRIKLTVQVLRNVPQSSGGTPVVTMPDDAERRVLKWLRRVYAQASLSPKLMQNITAVDPPANLVSISNDTGLAADGTEQFQILVTGVGQPNQTTVLFAPVAGATPIQTATALAALVTAPYSARVTHNPAASNSLSRRSADIVITAPGGARVSLFRIGPRGTNQTLDIGRATPSNFQSWNVANFLVGSLQQRTVLKNFDTGDDRVDVFVVTQLTAENRAEAMMSGHQVAPARSAITQVKNSVFMTSGTMDGTNNNPFVLGHELCHVVAEVIHAPPSAPPNLVSIMDFGGTEVTNSVNASKRIRDGAVAIDAPAGNFNLVSRLRLHGAGFSQNLLETW